MRNEELLSIVLGVMLFGIPASYAQTTISVSPETCTVAAGQAGVLAVMIENVAGLHGIHAVMTFDNSVMCVDTIQDGAFLSSGGAPVFFSVYPAPGPTISSISIDQAILGVSGISGSGMLFRISLHGVIGGTSSVSLLSVDVRDSSNHSIPATVLSGTVIVENSIVPVGITQGWNMISNPMVTSNDSVRYLFPSSLFEYAYGLSPGAGYVPTHTLVHGMGYWEKFAAPVTQTIAGAPRMQDSIAVLEGWNMVGTISSVVDTSTISDLPSGLRLSPWYAYTPTGYSPVTQLIPGKGYWVKTRGPGRFILRTAGR